MISSASGVSVTLIVIYFSPQNPFEGRKNFLKQKSKVKQGEGNTRKSLKEKGDDGVITTRWSFTRRFSFFDLFFRESIICGTMSSIVLMLEVNATIKIRIQFECRQTLHLSKRISLFFNRQVFLEDPFLLLHLQLPFLDFIRILLPGWFFPRTK